MNRAGAGLHGCGDAPPAPDAVRMLSGRWSAVQRASVIIPRGHGEVKRKLPRTPRPRPSRSRPGRGDGLSLAARLARRQPQASWCDSASWRCRAAQASSGRLSESPRWWKTDGHKLGIHAAGGFCARSSPACRSCEGACTRIEDRQCRLRLRRDRHLSTYSIPPSASASSSATAPSRYSVPACSRISTECSVTNSSAVA